MRYQKPDHSWGPGTVVDLGGVAQDEVDDQPQWWRALKGLGMIVGVLTGGILLVALFVVIDGAWIGDD